MEEDSIGQFSRCRGLEGTVCGEQINKGRHKNRTVKAKSRTGGHCLYWLNRKPYIFSTARLGDLTYGLKDLA